jgi:CRISPR-associated protein Csd1
MLVQALAAYADEYLERDIQDPAFVTKPVRFWLVIDEGGHFLGLEERVRELQVEGRGKKPKTVRRTETMLAPRSPINRNTETFGLPCCDAASYVLGAGAWSKPKEKEKHTKQNASFKERIAELMGMVEDSTLKACSDFYADPGQLQKAASAFENLKGLSSDAVALVMRPFQSDREDAGGPVIHRKPVAGAWRTIYEQRFLKRHEKGAQGVCLITGEYGPLAITHEKIKGAAKLGGQASGVSLMSFDKAAFRSYNWDQNQNSPVHPERAFAYTLALNDLMVPGKHRQGCNPDVVLPTRWDCGQNAFLFWTREPADYDPFSEVQNPAPESVRKLFTRPWAGRPPAGLEVNRFYLLRVSATGGRLAVQDFIDESLDRVHQNIGSWFESLLVSDVFRGGEPAEPPPLWSLLQAMLPPRQDLGDKAAARFAAMLTRRALFGEPVGYMVLAAALKRLFVAQGNDRLAPSRMGLVRLSVNDVITRKGETPMPESLDPHLNHPAYLCGRLMALYETLQWQAHSRSGEGKVNVTVADRYYGQAMTNPTLALTSLEKLSIAHRQKLRRDNPRAFNAIAARIDDVMKRIGDIKGTFPGRLSLEDQGRFALGYHSQCAEDRRRAREFADKKKAGEEKSEQQPMDTENPLEKE